MTVMESFDTLKEGDKVKVQWGGEWTGTVTDFGYSSFATDAKRVSVGIMPDDVPTYVNATSTFINDPKLVIPLYPDTAEAYEHVIAYALYNGAGEWLFKQGNPRHPASHVAMLRDGWVPLAATRVPK